MLSVMVTAFLKTVRVISDFSGGGRNILRLNMASHFVQGLNGPSSSVTVLGLLFRGAVSSNGLMSPKKKICFVLYSLK